uniref:Uncharacterized protein n=1 Tax=Timema poppense TaxID=170557 RepID=A0A7R9GUB6_TIMPO|nr:unnamed protein product [Timema poppensis]
MRGACGVWKRGGSKTRCLDSGALGSWERTQHRFSSFLRQKGYKVKDALPNVYSSYDGDYAYTLVQDAVVNSKSKVRQRREKERTSYSDTDSDWSSLDGRQRTVESYCKVNRKQTPHKRIRKKRVIPVPTPRVPPTHPLGSLDAAGVLNFQGQEGGCETIDKVCSGTPSDISDVSDPETSQPGRYQKHSSKLKKKCLVKKPILNRGPPLIPSPPALKNSSQQGSALHQQMSSQFDDVFSPLSSWTVLAGQPVIPSNNTLKSELNKERKLCAKHFEHFPLIYKLTKAISFLDPAVAVLKSTRSDRLKSTLEIVLANNITSVAADLVDRQFNTKPKREGQFNIVHDDESSLEISSPRDVNSPMRVGGKRSGRDGAGQRGELMGTPWELVEGSEIVQEEEMITRHAAAFAKSPTGQRLNTHQVSAAWFLFVWA